MKKIASIMMLITVFLGGLSGCQKEDEILPEQKNNSEKGAVSLERAKLLFKQKQESLMKERMTGRSAKNPIEVSPNWEEFEQDSLGGVQFHSLR